MSRGVKAPAAGLLPDLSLFFRHGLVFERAVFSIQPSLKPSRREII